MFTGQDLSQFYIASREDKGALSSLDCLYFKCEHKFYERTHSKITRQWKSALIQKRLKYRLHFLPIYKLQITDGSSLEKYEQYTWTQGHLKFYTIPTSMINTVKPPSGTNSRNRPPPISYHLFNTLKFFHSKHHNQIRTTRKTTTSHKRLRPLFALMFV